MSRAPISFAALACAALLSTAAMGEEAKNPLTRPKSVTSHVALAGTASLPPAPDLKDQLALPAGSGSSTVPTDQVAAHLSMLRVVATVGNKAILRGPLGKSGNLAISVANADGPGASGSAGQAATLVGGQQDEKVSPVRSITVTNGDPIQLAGGIWVRPEIVGPSVRLYMQTSSKDNKSAALIYASTVEIADAASSELSERQFDAAKKDKPAK